MVSTGEQATMPMLYGQFSTSLAAVWTAKRKLNNPLEDRMVSPHVRDAGCSGPGVAASRAARRSV
jgi:hypothetical protein